MSQEQTTSTQTTNTNWVGIVAYLTWIGWIVAIIMKNTNEANKTEFNSFHIRQMLGILLTGFLAVIPILNIIVGIFLFVCWIMGFISALQGTMKEVPLVGKYYQQWFASL